MAMSQQPTPPVNKYTGSYTEDADGDGIRMNAFDHEDADIAFNPLRPETPCQSLSGTGGKYVKLGTGDPAGEGPVPHIPRQDARSPATRLLGRTEPHLREVEERQ